MGENPELTVSIEKTAQNFYSPDLPYHNFVHALKAVATGEGIVENCRKENISVEADVVRYALLFHDAGYHEDYAAKGFNFKTKEEYSAHLAASAMRERGLSEELIEKVAKAILGTHRDAEFNTVEEKIVRAADLAGLAGDYGEFLKQNKNLKKEAEILSGKKISVADWKRRTEEAINFYLKQDIRLTSAYEDDFGASVFHKKTRENLARFLREY